MARGATATAEAPAEETASIWDEITVETKAGPFTFREMDGETYDKCVELSTRKDEERGDVTDMVMLLRWLAAKSMVGNGGDLDKLEKINKLPFSARQKVLTEVNAMYFPDSVDDLVRQLKMRGYTVTPPESKDTSGNA